MARYKPFSLYVKIDFDINEDDLSMFEREKERIEMGADDKLEVELPQFLKDHDIDAKMIRSNAWITDKAWIPR